MEQTTLSSQTCGQQTAPRQFTLFKLPIPLIIDANYQVTLSQEEAKKYLIAQGDSLLIDQIERLRGYYSRHIPELLLVTAKKSPKTAKELKIILSQGFSYNGRRYLRFGKSASQSKEGITAFVSEDIFDSLYRISQMDLPVQECVISKYEAQRCLLFSSCTLVRGYMPRIVMIGEYQKTLKEQYIRYVSNRQKEFKDPATGNFRGLSGYPTVPL